MNPENKNKFSLFRINAILLIILMGAGFLAAAATPGDQEDEAFKKTQEIKLFASERESALKALSKLSISAQAGFNGHTSGDNNLYTLGLGVGVSKEMYPGEFAFQTSTSLVIQDSVLQENVTTMNLSYEHYLAPWLETYGFVQRFSNTFLSLRYRYEIGGGFKAEFNVLPNRWRRRGNPITTPQILTAYERYIKYLRIQVDNGEGSPNPQELRDLLVRLEDLDKLEEGILSMNEKKRSLLTLSLALSVFSELEKPENIAGVDSDLLKEQQRFRLSVRPAITFRPSRMIRLKGFCYYKYPLFKKDHPNDDEHYRIDLGFSAALNLSAGASWTKNVDLVFEYQLHYDNNPFGFRDYANQMLGIDPNLVNDTHDSFMIKLNVEF